MLSVDTYKEEIILICTLKFANTTAPELNLNPAVDQIDSFTAKTLIVIYATL